MAGKVQQLTMKDIAQMLGVSVATVSRALKGSSSISQEQREKIQKFAREHNYFPNVIAGQLRHSKLGPGNVIGVIIPQIVHYYFMTVLSGIERETSRRGYRIIVAQSDESYEREVEICEDFWRNKVAGIIVSQAKDTTKYDHFIRLQDNGVPLVFYDRICAGINCSRVVVDDYQAAYHAVNYLISRGAKRVLYFGTTLNIEVSKNRYNGFKDALYHNGLQFTPDMMVMCDNKEKAEVMAPKLMQTANPPDAIFAVNDDTAIGALNSLKRAGYSVPDQVQICGFTNGERAEACDPMLTTVEQRGTELGREAAEVLIDMAEGKYPIDHVEKRIVKTRLIIRGTTR